MNKEEKSSNKCPICGRPTHKESKYCIFHASAEEKTEKEFKKALKEYVNKIKEENEDYDFEKFIFIGDINFKEDLNVTIFKNADFREATFGEYADFREATFKGVADFLKATFKGDAEFIKATFGGYAGFLGATFGEDVGFGKATFKGNAIFGCATFKGADFVDANFEGGADFSEATFRGDAGFDKATFKGIADFNEATFKGVAGFVKANFEGDAGFRGTTFGGGVGLDKATFKGYVEFNKATFKGDAGFNEATFGEEVHFLKATFKGDADFSEVTFKGYADFWKATFEDDANFRLKYLIKIVDFSRIKVFSGKKLFIKLNNEKGKIFFECAYLENTYLDIELVEGILIDFMGALLKSTKIKKGQIENHILQEKKKKFYEAQEIYLLLKNNFHSIGQYKDESWAFTKERDMERMSKSFYSLLNKYKKYSLFKKILEQGNLLKRVIVKSKIFSKWLFSKKAIEWFNLSISDFIYQYGENPWRVIRFALIIIFLFAIILNFSGIINSDSTNLIIEFIKESQGNEYTLRYLGPILGSFLNCLYFSVVTFTTLGYGDFQPAVGLSRFFVSLESIIGAFRTCLISKSLRC